MKVNKEIQEELAALVPGFAWPDALPGFELPEGYFQNLPEQIRRKINTPARAVFPPGPGKQIPYDLPEGYFDHLPREVFHKIRRNTTVARLPRRRPQRYRWASAAVIAVLVAFSGLVMFHGNRQPTIDQQLAGLSDAAIEQYLVTKVNLLNTGEIYNDLDGSLQDVTAGSFSDEEIEAYLNDNAIEADSL